MGDEDVTRGPNRAATPQEVWRARLPGATVGVFETALEQLEISYRILTATLQDALLLCEDGACVPLREEAANFGDLFHALVRQLRGVLAAVGRELPGRSDHPSPAPLRADFFRSPRARQIARLRGWRAWASLRPRSRIAGKIRGLEAVLNELSREASDLAGEIAEGTALSVRNHWSRLEILHYDLNTCLRETTILLKSFLSQLPGGELPRFEEQLLAFFSGLARVPAGRPASLPATMKSEYPRPVRRKSRIPG